MFTRKHVCAHSHSRNVNTITVFSRGTSLFVECVPRFLSPRLASLCKRHFFHARPRRSLPLTLPPPTFLVEKKPPTESTLLTGSRLPKIFPRHIIRGTFSLARLLPLGFRLRSELVVGARNSSANSEMRVNHPSECYKMRVRYDVARATFG